MLNPLFLFYKLNNSERKILANNVTFYRDLPIKEQRKFEYRVIRFISKHNFVGREGVTITPIVKIIISSIAIMLTFKMSDFLFRQLKNIIIYPKDYLSFSTNKIHKGETNPALKTIVFSWQGFVKGIKIEDDNLNLGIHEFTHALYFSFLKKKGIESYFFFKYYENLVGFFEDIDKRERLKTIKYFRTYAYVNQVEFFAVITECYFETPKEFKMKLPEIFFLLNKIYKIY